MNWPIIAVIGTQLLFTTSDLLARGNMSKHGFTLTTFFSSWFLIYFVIRIIAMFGQLYVFTAINLGRTMGLFGATSLVLSNLLGLLVLKEVLTPGQYVGIIFAITSFLILSLT
jgi:uncharacterized membrane protein